VVGVQETKYIPLLSNYILDKTWVATTTNNEVSTPRAIGG
jgi:hypothetical protein